MFVRSVVEHGLEIRRAGGENHLVSFQVETITREGDINKGFMIEEILEDGKKIVLVIVPAETILLGLRRSGDCHDDKSL